MNKKKSEVDDLKKLCSDFVLALQSKNSAAQKADDLDRKLKEKEASIASRMPTLTAPERIEFLALLSVFPGDVACNLVKLFAGDSNGHSRTAEKVAVKAPKPQASTA